VSALAARLTKIHDSLLRETCSRSDELFTYIHCCFIRDMPRTYLVANDAECSRAQASKVGFVNLYFYLSDYEGHADDVPLERILTAADRLSG
jgi:hypothetical protein